MKPLILASTSPYRKRILERLGLPFTVQAPDVDEEAIKNSHQGTPLQLAQALALRKAQSALAAEVCVLGGDQIVTYEDRIFGKPKSREKAIETLEILQGKTHEIITAMCVCYGEEVIPFHDITTLRMRRLTLPQIKRYVTRDLPLDCAGAYKIERSGISLFESIDSKDFSAIEGIPLLKLTSVLHSCGYEIP